jgi:hypothetical protein
MKKTFGQIYLKQRHFEIFRKSGGFYSLRSYPEPDPVYSEVGSGSGQNGPDPPTLVETMKIFEVFRKLWENFFIAICTFYFSFVSVVFFIVSVQPKHQNTLFRYWTETTETNV